jgi:hypothetical protein
MIKLTDILREVLKRNMITSFDITKDQLSMLVHASKDEEYEGLGMAYGDWLDDGATHEEIVDDMWNWFFEKDFPEGFRNVPDPIPLKRYIMAKSVDDINLDDIGQSWFATEGDGFDQALAHLGKDRDRGHNKFMISADVPMRNVNIPYTIMIRNIKSYENEFVVDKQQGIKNIKVEAV